MKKDTFKDYIKTLYQTAKDIEATIAGRKHITPPSAIKKTIQRIIEVRRKRKKIIFIGNGGSASIASHQAIDYWKNGGIKAIAFNDSALLTCLSNDFGYEYVFQKPIERFTDKGDLVFAISSSGKSRNILNAARSARDKGALVITLSGFRQDNPLRKCGDINFYVPFHSYGIVEITHLSLCHCILDYIIDHNA